jgi:hypothetical protein
MRIKSKLLFALLLALALSICVVAPVSAGGDQVRGENGQGEVVQVQVQDPPPFQP